MINMADDASMMLKDDPVSPDIFVRIAGDALQEGDQITAERFIDMAYQLFDEAAERSAIVMSISPPARSGSIRLAPRPTVQRSPFVAGVLI